MKIAIIGAGWLGCHLALSLSDREHQVSVFETQSEIFGGASGFNQCRLHLGFHYPRATATRAEAQKCFEPFYKQYENFIVDIPNNLYAVAKNDSKINFEDFCKVYQKENLDFKTISAKDFSITNVQGLINTEEKALNLTFVKKHFLTKLKNSLKLAEPVAQISKTNTSVIVNGEQFDYCINCTYQQFLAAKSFECFYEPCIMFSYKRQTSKTLALTIVDGPFGSFYPCPTDSKQDTYYLSTVPDTPLAQCQSLEEAKRQIDTLDKPRITTIKTRMEKLISEYYPNFRDEFEHLEHATSIKTKIFSADDERNSFFARDGRSLQAFIGKLSQVCLMEEQVLNAVSLEQSNN